MGTYYKEYYKNNILPSISQEFNSGKFQDVLVLCQVSSAFSNIAIAILDFSLLLRSYEGRYHINLDEC